MRRIDRSYLVGRTFGRWKVIGLSDSTNRKIRCQCLCGTIKEVFIFGLENNTSTSCGCFAREETSKIKKTHGLRHSAVYKRWCGMRSRSSGKWYDKTYKNVTCDPSWKKFENFYKDMGDLPTPKHSLDRIDNNKGYSKDNCRWATRQEQQVNRRMTKWITFNGETLYVKQWAQRLGTSGSNILKRLKMGWPIEKALTKRGRE